MPYNVRFVSTYPPRRCGIGIYTRNLVTATGNFTSEVASRDVAAILGSDETPKVYSSPVDLPFYQHDPQAWNDTTKNIIQRAKERGDHAIASLQFEFGLGGECFVGMAKALRDEGFIVLSYLHTILKDPEDPMFYEGVGITQRLAESSDSLVTHTKRGIKTLTSSPYGIDQSKIKHIYHGIRLLSPTDYDRQKIKEKYEIGNKILITTLGMRGPDKGIRYGIQAYAKFLKESCTDSQRSDILYLIAGGCHPNFVAWDVGREWKRYERELNDTIDNCGLRWCRKPRFSDIIGLDFGKYDLVLVENFLDESELMEMYAATNMMVLPYLNMQQSISGVLSDTIGSRRVAIATKFDHALEVLNPQDPEGAGILGIREPDATGILVDHGENSIDQIAKVFDYLIIDENGQNERLLYEDKASAVGHKMSWDNAAWEFIDHARYLDCKRQKVNGRGLKFTREKPSRFAD